MDYTQRIIMPKCIDCNNTQHTVVRLHLQIKNLQMELDESTEANANLRELRRNDAAEIIARHKQIGAMREGMDGLYRRANFEMERCRRLERENGKLIVQVEELKAEIRGKENDDGKQEG